MKSDPASDAVLVAHMQECIARIAAYTDGDRSRFDSSTLVQDAVIRNLQTLTESSQRLSEDIRSTELAVPWRELVGFRNIVVHAYLALDMAVVWSIVESDLPALQSALERMAARLPGPTTTASPTGS